MVTTRIEKCRAILASSQSSKVEGLRVDLMTASAIVGVHDKLNEANREKFLTLPIRKMAEVSWKLIEVRINP